jgi:hypothetical protein
VKLTDASKPLVMADTMRVHWGRMAGFLGDAAGLAARSYFGMHRPLNWFFLNVGKHHTPRKSWDCVPLVMLRVTLRILAQRLGAQRDARIGIVSRPQAGLAEWRHPLLESVSAGSFRRGGAQWPVFRYPGKVSSSLRISLMA